MAAIRCNCGSYIRFLYYCRRFDWMSWWLFTLFPYWSLIKTIIFWCLLWIIELWKFFVFLSPSWSHWILDFCLHRISFYFSLVSIWSMREIYSSTSFEDHPEPMICCWFCFILSWSWFFVWIMSQNFDIFHSLIRCFRLFNSFWSLYIGDPKTTIVSFH